MPTQQTPDIVELAQSDISFTTIGNGTAESWFS